MARAQLIRSVLEAETGGMTFSVAGVNVVCNCSPIIEVWSKSSSIHREICGNSCGHKGIQGDRHVLTECSASNRQADRCRGFLKSAILHGRLIDANFDASPAGKSKRRRITRISQYHSPLREMLFRKSESSPLHNYPSTRNADRRLRKVVRVVAAFDYLIQRYRSDERQRNGEKRYHPSRACGALGCLVAGCFFFISGGFILRFAFFLADVPYGIHTWQIAK